MLCSLVSGVGNRVYLQFVLHLTLLVVRSPGGGAGHGPGHAQRPLQPHGHHLGQEEGGHDEPHLQHGDLLSKVVVTKIYILKWVDKILIKSYLFHI